MWSLPSEPSDKARLHAFVRGEHKEEARLCELTGPGELLKVFAVPYVQEER